MEDIPMPEDDATIQAEGGKRVTITIAEKGESDPPPNSDPNTFVIDNGFQILTITIAE
jgi:hypothetical protein